MGAFWELPPVVIASAVGVAVAAVLLVAGIVVTVLGGNGSWLANYASVLAAASIILSAGYIITGAL